MNDPTKEALEAARDVLQLILKEDKTKWRLVSGIALDQVNFALDQDPKKALAELKPGAELRCIKGFTTTVGGDELQRRLTKGKIYILEAYESVVYLGNDNRLQIVACDQGYTCWWAGPEKYFEPA